MMISSSMMNEPCCQLDRAIIAAWLPFNLRPSITIELLQLLDHITFPFYLMHTVLLTPFLFQPPVKEPEEVTDQGTLMAAGLSITGHPPGRRPVHNSTQSGQKASP